MSGRRPAPDPSEHHISVARTARYWTLGPLGGDAREMWLVCHGYGQLAREFITQCAALHEGGRLVVAPEALSRYYVDHAARRVGATWMTSEDRLTDIDDYVHYLDRLVEHVGAGIPVAVLGFSQGTATACRWVTYGASRPAHLVIWGAPTPPDLDLAAMHRRLAGEGPVIVGGRRDPHFGATQVERERERLTEAGLSPRTHLFDGGHRLDDETLRAVAQEMERV